MPNGFNGHQERVATGTIRRETMYLFGGAAMVLFGAGLILSNPTVRRYLGRSASATCYRRLCRTLNDT